MPGGFSLGSHVCFFYNKPDYLYFSLDLVRSTAAEEGRRSNLIPNPRLYSDFPKIYGSIALVGLLRYEDA
jgi:hypothetical protein